MIKDKRILLTGGAGFIGTRLCDILCKDNNVVLFDNLDRNSIKNTNLLENDNVTLIKGDILNSEDLKKCVNEFKPNIVIHLAAVAGIDTVIKNPVKTMKVNMVGTYNLLEALTSNLDNLEKVIDFSTSEVFGTYAYKVNESSSTNLAPVGEARWTYSVSKLAAEHLSHAYYKEYNMPIVTVRPFNVYGPGQVGEGAIHQFVKRAINNEEIQIHGDGDQIRSWCYIDDFVQGIMLCLEKSESIGNAFNIGNPKGTITIGMLAQLVKSISNSNSNIKYVDKNYVDVELRIPSIDKAKEILGFNPEYDLNAGLMKTIEWYREKNND
ncbi:NAD-dependent epimerase/dehydratase family protein [Clostridium ihumii]|uniref:NAD-dependent epimerase/dehydratase family protein n=1 Tax=Clostridium ihumii TaxID=1470356 RepID=UPI0005900B47|nr:NAD-dependent epimerase/dehydratase family protein [Clostridium ihumii]